MTDVDLKITGSVEALHLEPGDRLIVSFEKEPEPTVLAHLRELLNREFPDHRVILITNGMTFAKMALPDSEWVERTP